MPPSVSGPELIAIRGRFCLAIESGLDKEEAFGYLLLGTLGSSDFCVHYCYYDCWGSFFLASSFV